MEIAAKANEPRCIRKTADPHDLPKTLLPHFHPGSLTRINIETGHNQLHHQC